MRIGKEPSRGMNMVFTPFWGVLYSLRRKGHGSLGIHFCGGGVSNLMKKHIW